MTLPTSDPPGPVYPLVQVLPTIPVQCYAGQPLTITVPVLGASGTGTDVAGLDAARAHVRTRTSDELLLHAWDTALGNAELTGTPGGTDAAVVLTTSGAETALWQAQWPRLDVLWDVEVEDTTGEPHRLCAASRFVLLAEITRAPVV